MVGAVVVAIDKRQELARASHLIGHLRWGWLILAVAFEMASMVAFARLQWWLLRAGGIKIRLWPMVEITFAGNALGTSFPGGAAWSATWAFGQLRRRGADRLLAGWAILVAGALSSFALFLLLAAGAFLAGSKGPVASLRVVAGVLAAIPVLVGLAAIALHRSARLRGASHQAWEVLAGRLPLLRRLGQVGEGLLRRIRAVQPGHLGWLEALGLALASDDLRALPARPRRVGPTPQSQSSAPRPTGNSPRRPTPRRLPCGYRPTDDRAVRTIRTCPQITRRPRPPWR
jgi:uncharacterized membrane protein YbhN (UPF0104 family)